MIVGPKRIGGATPPAPDHPTPPTPQSFEARSAPFTGELPPIRGERVGFTRQLERYRDEAYQGIVDLLLSPRGLPYDRVSAKGVDRQTSPTNVGLWIATIAARCQEGKLGAQEAQALLDTTLGSLARLDRDPLGFFYNWYDADALTVVDRHRYVSSVDNGNLIICLEGARQAFADRPDLASRIDGLLEPMKANFRAAFLEGPHAEGRAGTIRLGYTDEAGQMLHAVHHYDRFGSEARAIVALLEAEGHLPAGTLDRMAKNLVLTEHHYTIDGHPQRASTFKTWDGGVFQALLPNVLLGEAQLSRSMKVAHHNLAAILMAEGHAGLPAAYSASDLPGGGYQGKHGLPALAEDAAEVKAGVLTPHAIFLLGSVDRTLAGQALVRLQAAHPELHTDRGFYDALDVQTGQVGKSMLSLDQLMSVLGPSNFGKLVQARIKALAGSGGRQTLKELYRTIPLDLRRSAPIAAG